MAAPDMPVAVCVRGGMNRTCLSAAHQMFDEMLEKYGRNDGISVGWQPSALVHKPCPNTKEDIRSIHLGVGIGESLSTFSSLLIIVLS